MAHFAARREIGVKVPVRAASVDPKSTQLTPLTIGEFKDSSETEVNAISDMRDNVVQLTLLPVSVKTFFVLRKTQNYA